MFLIDQILCSWNRILLKMFYIILLNELPSNHRNVLSMCTIEKNTKSEFLINIFFSIYPGSIRIGRQGGFVWYLYSVKKIIWNHPKLYEKYLNWNWWKVECKKGLSWVSGDFVKLWCEFYEVVWISRLKIFLSRKQIMNKKFTGPWIRMSRSLGRKTLSHK